MTGGASACESVASVPQYSGRGGRSVREPAAGGARGLTARRLGRREAWPRRAVADRRGSPAPPSSPRAAGSASAAPQVAAGRAAGRHSLRLRRRGLHQPPRPAALGRPLLLPPPAWRWTRPLPAAAGSSARTRL